MEPVNESENDVMIMPTPEDDLFKGKKKRVPTIHCNYPGCNKYSGYNYSCKHKRKYCFDHKEKGMISTSGLRFPLGSDMARLENAFTESCRKANPGFTLRDLMELRDRASRKYYAFPDHGDLSEFNDQIQKMELTRRRERFGYYSTVVDVDDNDDLVEYIKV